MNSLIQSIFGVKKNNTVQVNCQQELATANESIQSLTAQLNQKAAWLDGAEAKIAEMDKTIHSIDHELSAYQQKMRSLRIYQPIKQLACDIRPTDYVFYNQIKNKSIVLFGDEKCKQDVVDFFYDLNIIKHIYFDATIYIPHELSSTISDYTFEDESNELVLICSFDTALYEQALQSKKLVYGKHYIFISSLIKMVDETEAFELAQQASDKEIFVLGVGYECDLLLQKNPHLPITAFIEASATEDSDILHEKPFYSLDYLKKINKENAVIIVASNRFNYYKSILQDNGFIFGESFFFFEFAQRYLYEVDYTAKLSDLLYLTMTDSAQYDITCNFTSRKLKVDAAGDILPCCKFNLVRTGNICFTSFRKVLQSVAFRVNWLSIANRTYSFCSSKCVYLDITKKAADYLPRLEFALPKIDDYLFSLDYDSSCNLKCKSCRMQVEVLPQGNIETIERVHAEIVRTLPDFNNNLTIGNGEFFFSKYYQDIFLDKYTGDELEIISNGTLFNKERWEKLKARYNKLTLSISIDASTDKTYKSLRGGSYTTLLKNLHLAKELREKNELSYLSISFVVQHENFREMPDFVSLGISICADEVIFARILNWGTYSDTDFALQDVCSEQNAAHKELLLVLQNNIFNTDNLKIVLPSIEAVE